MSDSSQEVHLALADFDRSQLPESQRNLQDDEFRHAVQDYLSAALVDEVGAAEVVVTRDRIIIRWAVFSEGKTLDERGIDCLNDGDYEKGISILRLALQRNPADSVALLNLGMALSDRGALDEATVFLKRFLDAHPDHAHGWVALGVALARSGDEEAAVDSLRKAVTLNPEDGHSHKNLGALLSRSGNVKEGLMHLRLATALLPSDLQAWFNLAKSLEDAGESDEADEAYLKVLTIDPNGQMGEAARLARNRIVENNFRGRGGKLRPDAFSFCLGALQRFDGMTKAEIQKIAFEIAMLGTRGLQINDPAEQYTLNSIAGKFSGLHLLCIQYVGFQLMDPSVNIGFDLSQEYAAAIKIHLAKKE